MKYFFSLLLLVTMLPAEAQSLREDLGAMYPFIKTKALIEQQKYDSALIWADTALVQAAEEYGKKAEMYVLFLRNLELAYGNVGREKEMEPIYDAYYEELKIAPTDGELIHNLKLKSFVEVVRVVGNDNMSKNLSLMQQAEEAKGANSFANSLISNPKADTRSWTSILAFIDLGEEFQHIDASTQDNKGLFKNTPIEDDAHAVLDAINIFQKGKATKKTLDKNKEERGEENSGGLASMLGLKKNKKGEKTKVAPKEEENKENSQPFENLPPYSEMSEDQRAKVEAALLETFYQKKNERDTSQSIFSDADYATYAFYLGHFYEQADKIQKADTFFAYANEGFHKYIDGISGLTGHEEQLRSVMNFFAFSNLSNSFVLRHYKDYPSITGLSYNNILLEKGLLLEKSRTMQQAVLASNDDYLLRVYNLWTDSKNLLAANYSVENEQVDIDSVTEANNELRKELSRHTQNENQWQWQAVHDGLAPDEAVVEFLHFPIYKQSLFTPNPDIDEDEIESFNDLYDSLYYVALVLRPEDTYPQLVPLFKEKQLQPLLEKADEEEDAPFITRLYNPRGVGVVNTSQFFKGDSLYQLIWQPLDALLKNVQTIYYSPSGLLHQIAFTALPSKDGVLLDRYQLHQVSSTRILANRTDALAVVPKSAALFGDIPYNASVSELRQVAMQAGLKPRGNVDTLSYLRQKYLREENSYFGILKTKDEVVTIASQLRKNQISVNLFIGNQALEEQFKELGMGGVLSPSILHVATHGFFLGDTTIISGEESLEEITVVDALARSGLAFAGANRLLKDESDVSQDLEDGILLASEAAQMNLQNTQLVVLSACETGLGEVQGSEGVYGLQRSIREAGAQFLIMSLWSVDDDATVALMKEFYNNWITKKQNIRDAFTHAQKTMRENHIPYEWAGFVLIE